MSLEGRYRPTIVDIVASEPTLLYVMIAMAASSSSASSNLHCFRVSSKTLKRTDFLFFFSFVLVFLLLQFFGDLFCLYILLECIKTRVFYLT